MSQDLLAPGRIRVGFNRKEETRDYLAIFCQSSSGETVVQVEKYSNTDNAAVIVGRARGSSAAPATIASGDIIGEFEFFAYTNQWHHCAEIISHAEGTIVAGTVPDSTLDFYTTSGGNLSRRLRVFSMGRVALGDAQAQTLDTCNNNGLGTLWIAHNDASTPIGLQRASTDSGSACVIYRKSRGTLAAPATVATNDEMMYLQGSAYTNAWHDNVGAIAMYIDGAVTAGQRPGNRIVLRTGTSGAGGPSDRVTVDSNGNVGFNTTSFGASSIGVLAIGNRTTAPTGNPTAGGVLYAEAGAGKWRGSGGTITTFGPADPHCPVCQSDFGVEYERPADVEPDPEKRYLALCFQCLINYMGEQDSGRAKPWIRKTKPVEVGPA